MTPDDFASALAEFAPDDTKVIMTSTSDAVVFSAIPRNKDSESLPERHFSTTPAEIDDIYSVAEIPLDFVDAIFGEGAGKAAAAKFAAKEEPLTKAEEASKERVAEKIQLGRKPRGK